MIPRLRLHDVDLPSAHARGILGVQDNMDYTKEFLAGEWRSPPKLNTLKISSAIAGHC